MGLCKSLDGDLLSALELCMGTNLQFHVYVECVSAHVSSAWKVLLWLDRKYGVLRMTDNVP